jgi:sulfite exporter TauE/SafE
MPNHPAICSAGPGLAATSQVHNGAALIWVKADGGVRAFDPAMSDALSDGGLVAEAVALCGRIVSGDGALLVAMAMAGLIGGFVHCAGMCGPFVLAQTAGGAVSDSGTRLTEWGRLRGAALIPYHLGRMTTYGVLGAVAAALAGRVQSLPTFRWLAGGLLILAAILFVVQAWSVTPWRGVSAAGGSRSWLRPLTAALQRAMLSPTIAHRYGLGLALGFLPCGMLYGAVAAAASTGSAVGGAAAMAAFAVGTVPSLVAVGFAGAFFGRRWRTAMRPFAATLFTVNAGFLTVLAWSYLSAA